MTSMPLILVPPLNHPIPIRYRGKIRYLWESSNGEERVVDQKHYIEFRRGRYHPRFCARAGKR